MDGTLLSCRFALTPNVLHHCGPNNASDVLSLYIRTGENQAQAQKVLSEFESLYPYLQLIASRHNLSPFDDKVAEAYWFGNELLDVFSGKDYRVFLPELQKRGMPKQFIDKLLPFVPDDAIPHHAFHVFFIAFQVTGKVPPTLENMLSCMATWGKVTGVGRSIATVNGPTLQIVNNQYEWVDKPRAVDYDGVKPEVGDMIAMHWGKCVHVLDKVQLANLEKYTKRVVNTLNSLYSVYNNAKLH